MAVATTSSEYIGKQSCKNNNDNDNRNDNDNTNDNGNNYVKTNTCLPSKNHFPSPPPSLRISLFLLSGLLHSLITTTAPGTRSMISYRAVVVQ